jgi:type IV pilus assembly protein PilC
MNYAYIGYTENREIVKGVVSAGSVQDAEEMLTKVGYRVVNLKKAVPFLPSLGKHFSFGSRVKTTEIITFSRQLALFIESGGAIAHSLALLQKQTTTKSLSKVLGEVVSDLLGGSTLSSALDKHPEVFPQIYRKMVSVGEKTGDLPGVLRNLADHMEKESTATKKLKNALTYPAIILVVVVIVAGVIVSVVLPPVVGLFASLGSELPMVTKALLAVAGFFADYSLYVFLGLLGLVLGVIVYVKSKSGHYQRDKIKLKLPLLGRLSLIGELAQCCRNLAMMFRAGLPIIEALKLTNQASGNQVVARALSEVEYGMIRGEGLAKPMSRNSVFPPLMVEMVRVVEETGNLDSTLMTVAANYEIELEDRMRTLLALIEPVMTIAMGLVIAFIAMAVFMPIYSSLGSIS